MSSLQLGREQCRQIRHSSRAVISCFGAPLPSSSQQHHRPRLFSQTSSMHADEAEGSRVRQRKTPTTYRRKMYAWLRGPGESFRFPIEGNVNYISRPGGRFTNIRQPAQEVKGAVRGRQAQEADEEDLDGEEGANGAEEVTEEEKGARAPRAGRSKTVGWNPRRPFPLNDKFESQNVLSDEFKDQIYKKVVEEKQSAAAVAVLYSVDVRRVAAVVRLKAIELQWAEQNKPLIKRYADSIMSMLPQEPFRGDNGSSFETITDVPVHPATHQQIFYPASESRSFSRADAARVFSPTLLSVDERMPHPELIEISRDEHVNKSDQVRQKLAEEHRRAADRVVRAKEIRQTKEKDLRTQTVHGPKWDFKIESINADQVGKNGRSSRGVGWRYGMPHEDRKRGNQTVIPTSVPA